MTKGKNLPSTPPSSEAGSEHSTERHQEGEPAKSNWGAFSIVAFIIALCAFAADRFDLFALPPSG